MSSAFPKWLKRFDPLLEEIEQTNPIYEAFRSRREAYRRRWLPGPHSWLTSFAILLVVIGLLLIPISCGLSLVIPLAGVPMLRHRLAHRILPDSTMPLWLDGIFSFQGIHIRAATDLWLAGASGMTISQGIYADAREREWMVFSVLSFAVSLSVMLLTWICSDNMLEMAVATIPSLYLIFVTVYGFQCLAMRSAIRNQLIERCMIWMRRRTDYFHVTRALMAMGMLGVAFCLLGVAWRMLQQIGVEIDRLHQPFLLLDGPVRASWILLHAAVVAGAACLHYWFAVWRIGLIELAGRVFCRFDADWSIYMNDLLLEELASPHARH